MRLFAFLPLAALASTLATGCGGDDTSATHGETTTGAGASGAGGDGGSGGGTPACAVVSAIAPTGDAIPGADLALAVTDDGSGAPYDVAWTVSAGTLSSPSGVTTTWTLPGDVAVHVAETLHVTAVVTAEGCADQTLDADVTVDWPDALRTIVISNPSVTGSDGVASHYADFRQIPADHLCPIAATDPTTLAGADFDAYVDSVMACVGAVGPHVHYIVPVWGVPYKVTDRIGDLANNAVKATVCLDALLAYGDAAKTMTQAPQNVYYQDGDSPTATYDPYVPFGELRDAKSKDFFLVARIDGADADAAKALVDRTAAADALAAQGQLEGTVYVDGNKGLPHPAEGQFGSYEWGEWNIIGVESVFTAAGTYPVVADYNGEEFGTAPAPLTCPDALYYAGWYSFGNYNDVFTWKPGAIGGHLDSCSACDIRGDVDWSARALREGITATFGAVNEPYVAGMPEYDQFFLYLTQGASFGEAAYESTVLGAWMMVWVGDPLYRPYAKP